MWIFVQAVDTPNLHNRVSPVGCSPGLSFRLLLTQGSPCVSEQKPWGRLPLDIVRVPYLVSLHWTLSHLG